MNDITLKRHFKIDGLNHAKRLEEDKIQVAEDELERKLKQQEKEAELKRTLYGRLDPTHMDINLPAVPDESGVSFDPEDMVFSDKLTR